MALLLALLLADRELIPKICTHISPPWLRLPIPAIVHHGASWYIVVPPPTHTYTSIHPDDVQENMIYQTRAPSSITP